MAQNPVKWMFIDPILSRTIYDLYKSGDSDVAIALRILRTKSMYGGVCYRWGDADKQRHDFGEAEKEWIIALMEEGLKWKSMFGMCPYQESTTDEGLPSISIPMFGEGKFMWKMSEEEEDGEEGKLLVMWQTKRGAMRNPLIPDLPVFVWPRHRPDVWSLAPFDSSGTRLLRLYLQKEELIVNTLDADFSASHPPVLTQHRQRVTPTEDQYDTEIFADVMARGEASDSPEARHMYRIDRDAMTQQGRHLHRVNHDMGIVSRLGMGMGGHFIHTRRLYNFQQAQIPLPVGQEPARYQMPQIRSDLMNWIEHWKMAVCGEIGVPASCISRQRDGRRGGSSKTLDEGEASNFQTAISDARGDMALFFETAYRKIRGPDQESMLMSEIMHLRKNENSEAALRERFRHHLDEGRRIERIQDEAEKRQVAGARSKREPGLRRKLAETLSVETNALFRIIQPETIDTMLDDRKEKREVRLGRLESMIEDRTRLRIVWGPAPILNWQFVVNFTQMGLIDEETVRKMVLSYLGLPEECDPSQETGIPASRKRKRGLNITSKGDNIESKRKEQQRPALKKTKTSATGKHDDNDDDDKDGGKKKNKNKNKNKK